MLAESFQEVPCEQVTEGVMLYRFTLDTAMPQGESVPEQARFFRQKLNLLFCSSGTILLRRTQGEAVEICQEEIVLLSDIPDLVSVSIPEPGAGCCLVIEPEVYSAFGSIYRTLGCTTWSPEEIKTFLQKHGGYLKITHRIWRQSVFSILKILPDKQQGPYCLMKAMELCYLIHSHQTVYADIAKQPSMPEYLVEQLISIGAYIENHMDEKLSISMLCHKFNLSPTTLKNQFREFYGQPIHNFIQYHRISRAAQLLQSTNMTVLQIAHSVGYESVSQFNVIFRRTYGTTPRVYRKMSDTVRK